MTIEFRCSCGAICRADESEVGHLFHCEACGLDVPVPPPEEAARSLQEGEPEPGSAETEAAAPDAAPAGDDESAPAADAPHGAADALREQLGGGGVGDIAAHIHDGEDEAALADAAAVTEKRRADADALREQLGDGDASDVAAAAEKRRGDADALREQLGGGGAADIADALRSEGVGADGQAAAGAPAIGTADLPASAASGRTAPKKKVLRGHERAAHHIIFKRAIWVPALLVGLVCLAVGVCAGVFRVHPRDIPDLIGGKEDLYAMHLARFHEKLNEVRIPVDGYEIVEHGGEAWAIPKGAEHRKTATGRVYYSNAAGFDEPALLAEDYAMSLAVEQRSQSGLLWFGVGLTAVGLVLIVLSAITYRDVRLVRAARAEAGAESEEAEGAPPAPALVSEAGEGLPEAEGGQSAPADEVATPPPPEDETPTQQDATPAEGDAPAGQTEHPGTGEAEEGGPDERPSATPTDADTDEDPPGPGPSV